MGSEPGMGWHWITSLAQYCECYVVSEGEFRPQVEQWMTQPANAATSEHLHFYWLPIGGDDAQKCSRIRQMCWNQGDWRFYYYYRKWQKRVADCARDIINNQNKQGEPIHILHQLNMIGFREPGYLWQVSEEKNVPFVWGPVDAKPGLPMAYAEGASIKVRAFLRIKNMITHLQLSYMPRVRKAANQASLLLSASGDSQQSILRYWNKQSILLNETGCSVSDLQQSNQIRSGNNARESFDILWCGKMDFRKQLDLAIRAMAESKIPNAVLHVVGDGNNALYKQLAEQLDVHVIWYGRQPHDEVQKIMQRSDVLLFTSVAEGTPHVVMEALANGLPVICHNTCGQGDVVTGEVGIAISLSTPKQSVKDFAEAMTYLWEHTAICHRMRQNCMTRAKELTWENKAQQLNNMYNQYCVK